MTKYNWQAESNRTTFRSWLVPTVLADDRSEERFEQISAATNKFTEIEFGITINGIPVDADAFLDGVEQNMRHQANDRAAEIIRESEQLDSLQSLLASIQSAAQSAIWSVVRGTELERYMEED
jgi:hypothetical protein